MLLLAANCGDELGLPRKINKECQQLRALLMEKCGVLQIQMLLCYCYRPCRWICGDLGSVGHVSARSAVQAQLRNEERSESSWRGARSSDV